jgi:hypothetical protein
VIGRKGVNYYRFRKREVKASWTGFLRAALLPNAARSRAVRAVLGEGEQADERTTENSRRRAAPRVHAVPEHGHADPQARGWRPWSSSTSRTSPRGTSNRCTSSSPTRTPVRRAAAQVHRAPAVRGAAGVGGVGVGQPPAGDEGRDRQCERADP